MRRPRQSRTSNLDLDVPGCLGNVDRLDTHLTIDSVRFAPCAYLVAQDINVGTGAWASRHDTSKILSVAGAGASPSYGNATAIENTAVKYPAAKYHRAGDTTWGQVTTGDGALEFLHVYKKEASTTILIDTISTAGFRVFQDSNDRYYVRYTDGTNTVTAFQGASAYATGQIGHVMAFLDRSENLYLYSNGVFTNSFAVGAVAGSLAGVALSIGAVNGGTFPSTTSLLQVGVWDLPTNPFPGALKNRTYFDKIARERFAIVAGIADRRQGAHTFTRATSAYLDKYLTRTGTTRFLHQVSAGWPRVCERIDTNGQRVTRFLGEPQATNLATNSEDMASWTAENLTTVTANGATAPNGETTGDGIVANATDTTHGIYGAYTLPATNHCLSAFVKVGNKGWIELYSSIANVSCYFHVAFGSVGTAGAAVTAAGIDTKPYGGISGYYRCWICFTGSADAKNYGVRAAAADADNTFAGDATTVNTWVWGIQIEATAEHFPSSYIPTAAAPVARNKDELSYNVRLPIVGNINDLPQTINIGGTDYAPCAYLVADDVQADGTWTSRHGAKSLAFTGAGTNPTRQWDAVSRANKSIKYWASNYHQAADTTWGQVTSGDYAVEIIGFMTPTAGNTFLMSTYNGTTGIDIYTAANKLNQLTRGSGVKNNVTTVGTIQSGTIFHAFFGIDESVGTYAFINGVYDTYTPATGTYSDSTGANFTIGALASDGSGPYGEGIVQLALWDLTTNPWPGAATNQAVMGAIARARFNQLFRYPSCRLDCEVLHPNVNRQGTGVTCFVGSVSDFIYTGVVAAENGFLSCTANNVSEVGINGSDDLCNNVSVKQSGTIRGNLATYRENNSEKSSDPSCSVPSGLRQVLVGQYYTGGFQPGCLVGSIKLSRSDK